MEKHSTAPRNEADAGGTGWSNVASTTPPNTGIINLLTSTLNIGTSCPWNTTIGLHHLISRPVPPWPNFAHSHTSPRLFAGPLLSYSQLKTAVKKPYLLILQKHTHGKITEERNRQITLPSINIYTLQFTILLNGHTHSHVEPHKNTQTERTINISIQTVGMSKTYRSEDQTTVPPPLLCRSREHHHLISQQRIWHSKTRHAKTHTGHTHHNYIAPETSDQTSDLTSDLNLLLNQMMLNDTMSTTTDNSMSSEGVNKGDDFPKLIAALGATKQTESAQDKEEKARDTRRTHEYKGPETSTRTASNKDDKPQDMSKTTNSSNDDKVSAKALATTYHQRSFQQTQDDIAPKAFQDYLQKINRRQHLFDTMGNTPPWVTTKRSIIKKEEDKNTLQQYVAPTETINVIITLHTLPKTADSITDGTIPTEELIKCILNKCFKRECPIIRCNDVIMTMSKETFLKRTSKKIQEQEKHKKNSVQQ
jgi:hypothetical protein